KTKKPSFEGLALAYAARNLALGVGRGLTRTLEAGLLTFLHTRVAGEEVARAHLWAQVGINLQQRAGNPQLDRVTLAADAAAANMHGDVVSLVLADGAQRLQQNIHIAKAREIIAAILI